MLEKEIEDVLTKHPELIEEGLTLEGRQFCIDRKFIDLLFKDVNGLQLLVEVKRDTVKRTDVAQLIDYAGYFIRSDKPPIRVMLVAPRIPQNFKIAFEYFRIEYRELALPMLEKFWTTGMVAGAEEKNGHHIQVVPNLSGSEETIRIKNIVRQATAKRVRQGRTTERERFAIELLSLSDKPVMMSQIKEFMTKKGISQKSYFDIFNGLCDAGVAVAVKIDGLKAYFMREGRDDGKQAISGTRVLS